MKLLKLFFPYCFLPSSVCLFLSFGILISGCTKKDTQPSPAIADEQPSAMQKSPVSAKVLYVEYINGITEGACLEWKSPQHCADPPFCNYCSRYATSDVARVIVKDWNTGLPVSNVVVTGNWSGGYSISGAIGNKTNSNGEGFVNGLSGFTSRVVFTVTRLSLTGSSYDATKNVMSSVTIR